MPITDLTGTKWLMKEEQFGPHPYLIGDNEAMPDPNEEDAPEAIYVIGGIKADFSDYPEDEPSFTVEPNIYIRYNDELEGWVYYPEQDIDESATPWQYYLEGTITNSGYGATLEITGGTDATNTDLINWLQENATQIIEPTGNTYNLTHTLTNLTKGNITIQITPDTGYTYPTSLTITNGTLVSYDNTTGIAVVNGDDTTIVNAECVEQASGYNLTISGVFEYGTVYDIGSKLTIDNTTCSVDYLGNATNIPHTFTNVTTFEIETNGNVLFCACKIISGSGTFKSGDYPSGKPFEDGYQWEILDGGLRKIIITITSDTVIQLGYYES